MFTLRKYQQRATDVAVRGLTKTKPQPFVIQAATGAGKSLIIAAACHKLDAPVLILQPTVELLYQNHAKLVSYGVTDIGVYSASANQKTINQYTFATIGSIVNKPELFAHYEYCLIDECDLVPIGWENKNSMYMRFFRATGIKNIMGLTATPYRMVQVHTKDSLYPVSMVKMLTRIAGRPRFWNDMPYAIQTRELQDMGYLCPIKYHQDSTDLHRLVVNSNGGDFTQDSLESWGVEQVGKIVDYVKYVDTHANRNLVFCASVEQAELAHDALEACGVASAVVTGETPARERTRLVAAFRGGEIRHMLNVGVFIAGFDVPELDCITYARPTLSPRIWYQAVGRGVRIDPANPGKRLRVFDLSGTYARMGPVENLRLGKEDGYKDTLSGTFGRLDNTPTGQLYRAAISNRQLLKT